MAERLPRSSARQAPGRIVGSDTVSLTGTAVGTFANAGPGTGITVTVSGQSLTGAQSTNYSLTEPTTTATINYPTPTLTSIANHRRPPVLRPLSHSPRPDRTSSMAPRINWNGVATTTTYVSASSLTATISTTTLLKSGSISITVTNPTPGGGTSGTQTLTVNTTTYTDLSDSCLYKPLDSSCKLEQCEQHDRGYRSRRQRRERCF